MTVADELLMRREQEPDLAVRLSAFGLSGSEARVAELLVRGLTNPEIAHLLRCSTHTVRNHLARLFKKVGVSTRAECVFLILSEATPRAPQPRVPETFIEHVRAAQRSHTPAEGLHPMRQTLR
jgi:DNA-binding CsgD family transcriptional regulator